MITRGELKGRILRHLNKTGGYSGFYGDDKIADAIQEAMDSIAVEMFTAGEGWQSKLDYRDTEAGQITLDIPPHVALIREVKYLVGTVYMPMQYIDAEGMPSYLDAGSGVQQWAGSYKIIDNAFVFDPPLAEGGTKYLQIEHVGYPKRMIDDNDFLEAHFDNALQHYLKYRVCSILASSIEKKSIPWAKEEAYWYAKMVEIVGRRNLRSTPIGDYEGW